MDYRALSSTDLVLHCLRTGEESAWVEFVRRFQPLIAGVVGRVARRWGGASPELLDDLVQETYLKLCSGSENLLQNFQSSHPDAIFGFIKVFTANLVHDHFKGARSMKRGGGSADQPIDGPISNICAPQSHQNAKSIERQVLIHQIDHCLRDKESGPNAARDRHIFWLYYRVGLPASAIAAIPAIGLGTKGVESTILRLTRLVRQNLAGARVSPQSDDSGREGILPGESL
jgi:RNA polymerase sigma-70 factor (ECF subfamily)